jgi:hypothetical protein
MTVSASWRGRSGGRVRQLTTAKLGDRDLPDVYRELAIGNRKQRVTKSVTRPRVICPIVFPVAVDALAFC